MTAPRDLLDDVYSAVFRDCLTAYAHNVVVDLPDRSPVGVFLTELKRNEPLTAARVRAIVDEEYARWRAERSRADGGLLAEIALMETS